jgi:two-component system response regulator FixJ
MPPERIVHVVDDEADVLRALERLLVSVGFTPALYDSGFAVLDAASGLSVGCMLLDVRMPGMDGLELLAQLSDLGIRLPVILMTAHGDAPTTVRAMKIGAVDFIEKPLTMSVCSPASSWRWPRPSAPAVIGRRRRRCSGSAGSAGASGRCSMG